MAEATQYRFDLLETTVALIKQQGLTSGKWMISVEFKFTAGVIGMVDQQPGPSAVLQVSHLGLVNAESAPPELAHMVVDAAELSTDK